MYPQLWDNLKTIENELYYRKYYGVNVEFIGCSNWGIIIEESILAY